jgi:hypothetical protein
MQRLPAHYVRQRQLRPIGQHHYHNNLQRGRLNVGVPVAPVRHIPPPPKQQVTVRSAVCFTRPFHSGMREVKGEAWLSRPANDRSKNWAQLPGNYVLSCIEAGDTSGHCMRTPALQTMPRNADEAAPNSLKH